MESIVTGVCVLLLVPFLAGNCYLLWRIESNTRATEYQQAPIEDEIDWDDLVVECPPQPEEVVAYSDLMMRSEVVA